MRTRTLLLLAVGCGLLILVAGVVQLLRVAGQDEPTRPVSIGEPVQLGDLSVTVLDLAEADGQATVDVELGGVDDRDGADEFRLVVPGSSLAPRRAERSCAGTTVEVQRCALVFDLPDEAGTTRVLLYRRGDEQVRWELIGG